MWICLYPSFHYSRPEAALLLIAFFFFLGVQRFEDDWDRKETSVIQNAIPAERASVSRFWMRWRTVLLMSGGIVSMCVFLFLRTIRH